MADAPLATTALPWGLLTAPATTWRQIALRPLVWPVLLGEWLLLVLGWLAAGRAYADLSAAAAGKAQADPPALLGVALGLLPLLVLVNLGLGGATYLLLNLIGVRQGFRMCLAWAAYGHFPVFIGRAMGLLVFGFSRPLADNAAQATALQMSPAPLGFAPLLQPLSFPWTLAVFFDVFGIWAAVLLLLGARHMLHLDRPRTASALAVLVLLWLLVLTGVWQTVQVQAVRGV
jgi:hypothetical protein